jgi:hypothetical protein
MNILRTQSFCPQIKTLNRMLTFSSTHFDYWNQPLTMRIHVCYLDCHEAGLCCYLVIHVENRLRPLQLFYFRLWPIYWLSLVYSTCVSSYNRLGSLQGQYIPGFPMSLLTFARAS